MVLERGGVKVSNEEFVIVKGILENLLYYIVGSTVTKTTLLHRIRKPMNSR